MPLRLERRGIPISSVDDWFRHARPMGGELAWREGRSAKELAKAWCREGADPAPPAALLGLLSSKAILANLAFDVGYPRHRCRCDEVRDSPKDTDLAIVCDGLAGRVAISIEAMAHETFRRTVGEEIVNAAAQWAFEEEDDRLQRLKALVKAILPAHRAGEARIGELKYELLAAIALAWAFAAEQQARVAVLVIHEFLSPRRNAPRLSENRNDLARLITRLTGENVTALAEGTLAGPLPVPQSPSWPGVTEWYVGKCQTNVAVQA